ncbi:MULTISPECIES: metallophosphoesterase [unclassified Cellulophaga]|uniref:metallophosphoesterase n=1 Tax=unclassified Cellulophaga TaxID=2634405 RepID=UPI0026E3FF12|nr:MULTISPECIES: metallophosphoesterase [unclassified Cellulophaga]MDO6490012.1 metallophosphoesterase [Cellulophaga sp. 2_MG-2023]MDO6494794.1 metallophosphoesterase [Cellulophaga sp. 3_MG-2023]
MNTSISKYCWSLSIFILTGCATVKTKYDNKKQSIDVTTNKEIEHTFYLIGDAGKSPINGMNPVLKSFKKRIDKADKNSSVLFLGDNIYPAGMPDPKDSTAAYLTAKSHLDAQLKTLENFKGKPLFIPGNHDWYTEGLVGLEREQKYIQEALGSKDVFLPEDGCPLETIEVNDNLIIIAIDTEWYLTNWNKRPDINDKCDIKSREKFLIELESLISKNRQKTTVIAMHHPMFSYGSHGGQYSFKKHFYPKPGVGPLPILGTFLNILRKTAGPSSEDLQGKRYRELRNRVVTLAQYSNKVIFVSGHEHSLQYIVEENTPQIVSGAGAKSGETRLINGSKFSTGEKGYATLEVYKDGSSRVRYFGLDDNNNEKFLFTSEVLPEDKKLFTKKLPDSFPATTTASIYTQEEITKTGFHNFIWGDRYRKYYGTSVTVPTLSLDTIYGGLTPVRAGGGHQSKSLRLADKNGKEYVMRSMRKSAELYLQSMAFKDQYVVGEFENTAVEKLLMDFYTGSHPYAPYIVSTLSDAIDIYHTNPKLYYIPKQKALGDFNVNYGDELYMFEEHAGDNHGNLKSFGYANELKSTDSMLEDLRDDEKYAVDDKLYLRARLFDMVIGDWDRHTDQWRWAENKKNKKIIYKPVPRDRDQVFSNMGDGPLMSLATRIVPSLRLMEGFNEEIRSVRGFNSSPKTYVLDIALLSETNLKDWITEAEYIQDNLTEDVINKSFKDFPVEIQDSSLPKLKEILLSRISHLKEYAKEYHRILNKFAVVTGTDKDDWFEINHLNKKEVQVKAYRNIKGEKDKLFFDKTFNSDVTKEIWIYGLDDDDYFEDNGTARNNIRIRIIGGQNNDIYNLTEGQKITIYDYKSKKNTFKETNKARIKLTNDYNTNVYNPLAIRNSVNQIIPTVGFNPDDGLKIGFTNTFTYNGFRLNPFTEKHTFNASFYFATQGFDFGYTGEFANIFGNWNFEVETRFTSPNFSVNFFGLGNKSINNDDNLGMDYNRVKLEQIKVVPSIVYNGQLGSKFKAGIGLETIEVEETEDRFINTFYVANNEDVRNTFLGVDATYTYENKDNAAFPTMGMSTMIKAGYKQSLVNDSQNYAYIIPSLAFDYKLVPNGRLVLATKWKAHFNIGDDYEFYQGATVGGIDGLRGYRNQRFTGKKAYYQNTDIRFSLRKMKTNIIPISLGVYSGFDYGRIWLPTEDSDEWKTSYGGGLFLNGANVVSARVALFYADEGPRFTFGLGFGF